MFDSYNVLRDAEALARAWGPIHYLYPHLMGGFTLGSRIGVIIGGAHGGNLRYGHMTLGLKQQPDERGKGWQYVTEEDLLTGGRFQPHFKKHRCLIPVDHWNKREASLSGQKNFVFEGRKSTFCFAGLYSTFALPDDRRLNTVAIIGISASDYYAAYDTRMPGVFFPGPEGIQFIDPATPEKRAWELLRAFPQDNLTLSINGAAV